MSESRPFDLLAAGLSLVALVLAGFAYWPLVAFAAQPTLEREVEVLLFNTTAAGPPVVLLLAGWLLYRRWGRLRGLPPEGGSTGLAVGLLVPCAASYAWATYTGTENLLVLALMLHLMSFGALLWGPAALRVLWLPVAFLLFAMSTPAPLLNQILWKFQIWTANYTGFLLDSLGLTNLVTGDQIIRAEQNFAIIETCSGLRSVESLSMLAVLMIDLFRRRGAHALLLLALAPGVAFALNGLRAITLILNPHSEVVAIHTLQGISILLAGLLVLYGTDGLLERLFGRSSAPRANPGAFQTPGARRLAVGVTGLASLAGLSLALPRWQPPDRGTGPFPDAQIPESIDGWTSVRADTDREFLGIVGFRAAVDRRYSRGDEAVRMFVGIGGHEKRMSPFSPKTALPGSGWWVEESFEVELAPDQRRVRARLVRYGNGALRKLVYDWVEGTRGLGSEITRAALGLDTSAWHRKREGVALRLETRLDEPTEAERVRAESRLRAFYALIRPALDTLRFPRGTGS